MSNIGLIDTLSLSFNLYKNLNKVNIAFEIPDFEDVRRRCTRKADYCLSDDFLIGRSTFYLCVQPIERTKKHAMSVYLYNDSDHDVVVDYSIKAKGVPQHQEYGCTLTGQGDGVGSFMQWTKAEGSLKLVLEVTLKSEAIDSETNKRVG